MAIHFFQYLHWLLTSLSVPLRPLLFYDAPPGFCPTAIPHVLPKPKHRKYPKHYHLRIKAMNRNSLKPFLIPNPLVSDITPPLSPKASSPDMKPEHLPDTVDFPDFLSIYRTSNLFSTIALSDSMALTISDSLHQIKDLIYPYSHNALSDINPSHVYLNSSDKSSLPIVIDTGASNSVTPNRSDFTTFSAVSSSISGLNSTAQVRGEGTIRWKIVDENGDVATLETFGYYVPTINIRLYSPQSHFKLHPAFKASFHLTLKSATLLAPGFQSSLSFPINPVTNLPLMLTPSNSSSQAHYSAFPDIDINHVATSCAFHPSIVPPDTTSTSLLTAVTGEVNTNLSQSQLELLAWHQRLGHTGMSSIQRLMSPSKELDHANTTSHLKPPCVIPTKHSDTHKCPLPLCAACSLANMERISPSTSHSSSSSFGILKVDDLSPGDCISMDHFVVPHRGRTLPSKTPSIVGGTIFVDHASGRISLFPQSSLNTTMTLSSKFLLDKEAHDLGFSIKAFCSDNGV